MSHNGSPVVETPFLEAFAWESVAGAEAPASRRESPFLTPWSQESALEGVDADGEEVRSALAELHDSEFDEALYELVNEAAITASRVVGSPDAVLEAWVHPLQHASEQLFEQLAGSLARTRIAALSDSELDELVDEAAHSTGPLEPAFEQFFGRLLKKAKSVVKKVASVAKKGIALAQKLSPIHILLGKLKQLVKPLLRKVLQTALDRLPAAVRPAATKLARHLLGAGVLEAGAGVETEASANVEVIQREFDERVVNLLFTGEETTRELMLLEAASDLEVSGLEARSLDDAREKLITGLAESEPGEAGPVVEQFIPAILPALKLGIRLLGRPRVISTIASLVTKLIGRFVGPDAAPALSRALVDAGLKLLTLEAPDQERLAGAQALAATVEDVVRRVSEVDDEVLDDPRLLEAEVAEAVARSAAAHFPPELVKADLRESSTARGAWALFPRGRYKKYTRIFEVEITPELARSIQAFGGGTLEADLTDRLGLTLPLRARAHLYEGIAGTRLSRLARSEKGVAGLGPSARGAWRSFHPLTKLNATALLREPGLGRDFTGKFTASQRVVAVGQRLFYLEIPGAPTKSIGRASRVDVVADFPKNQVRVDVFLSEREAQSIAARLKSGNSLPTIAAALKELIRHGVQTALSGRVHGRVKIIHESVDQEGLFGGALKRVAGVVLEAFAERVSSWVFRGVADELQKKAGAFTAATDHNADGVTVRVTLDTPPGFSLLRAALKGHAVPLKDLASSFKGAPSTSVEVLPGFAT